MVPLIALIILFIPIISTFQDIDLSTYTGTQVGAVYASDTAHYFGFCVDRAGDINNDGVDDIVVGTPQLIPGSSNYGWVYYIFGQKDQVININIAQGIQNSQGARIRGQTPGDNFAWSMGSAGDVNGDRIPDLIVGALDAPVTQRGMVTVLYGRPNIVPIDLATAGSLPGLGYGYKVGGKANYYHFGNSVSSAGDINGDGIDDMIAAANNENSASGLTSSGAVYIIFGTTSSVSDQDLSVSFASTLGFKITGSSAYEMFGSSVSKLGDINGDGIDDILIGAVRYYYVSPTLYRNNPGIAYVIYGSKTGFSDMALESGFSSSQGFRIISTTAGNLFGFSVNSAGDLNGDGINDILIGAYQESPLGKTGAGTVFVIFGRKNGFSRDIDLTNGLSKNEGFQIFGENAGDNLGYAVRSGGDFNDDGISDIIIAALRPNNGGTNPGAAYVIFGRKTKFSDINLADGLDESQGFRIQNISAANTMASPISSAGDVNGDGVDDLVLGSSMNTNPITGGRAGSIHIIYGSAFADKSLLDTLATVQNTASQTINFIAIVMFVLNFSNAGPLMFGFLAEILKYMRYMQLVYPTKLQYILDESEPDFISIPYISNPPDGLEAKITNYPLPEKFEAYSLNSSFLINFWSSVTTIAIVIVLIFALMLFERMIPRKTKLNSICGKLKQALKWNYLIATFIGLYDNIALYTSLEITTIKFESVLEDISFVTCVIINLLALIILVLMWIVLKKLANERKKSKKSGANTKNEILKEDLKDCQVVFESFKERSLAHQCYMPIFCIRFYIFYTVIAYAYEYPLAQAITINALGMINLLYLIIFRPFKDIVELLSSLAQEVILQIVNVCVLLFCFVDPNDSTKQDYRITLGDIIIWCNLAFMAVGIVYMLILILFLLRDAYKWIKGKSGKKKILSDYKLKVPERQTVEETSSMNMTNLELINNITQQTADISLKYQSRLNMMPDILMDNDDHMPGSRPNRSYIYSNKISFREQYGNPTTLKRKK